MPFILAFFLIMSPKPGLVAVDSPDGIILSLTSTPRSLQSCIMGGIEVRYRFRARLCNRGQGWSPDCKSEHGEARYISFDPITERFLVAVDRFRDSDPAIKVQLPSLTDALELVSKSNPFSISVLADKDEKFLNKRDLFVKARVIAFCRGEQSILARVAELLTFGLVGSPALDSDWQRFDITDASVF